MYVFVSEMGGRQSQEPAPAPVDVPPPPPCLSRVSTHRSSQHQSASPPSLHRSLPTSQDASPLRLPTLSDYPHIRAVARPHTSSTSHRHHERHSSSRTPADQFLELNIALSTLQERLQARAEARERSLHPSSLPAGLPLLFFRPVTSKASFPLALNY